MKKGSIVTMFVISVWLAACTPPLGRLSLTPDAAQITSAAARAGHIGVAVAYDGEGFDPLKLSVYAALGHDPWSPAQTERRQYDRFEVLWPGGLAPVLDGDGNVTTEVVVQIQAVYTEGRQSVTARTAVTVVP